MVSLGFMVAVIKAVDLHRKVEVPIGPRKIFMGGGPDILNSPLRKVDLELKYGLSKFHGTSYWERDSGRFGLIIGSWEGDVNELQNIQVTDPTPQSTQEQFNLRQAIFRRLGENRKNDEPLPFRMCNDVNADSYVFRFAEILFNHNESLRIPSLPRDWQDLIRADIYTKGLEPKTANLARAFAWAIDSCSDTPEAQLVLARRMMREDPSNPIAWWYLAQLDTNHLRPLIDMDWQPQVNAIIARMGSWEIGKETLSKRFKESH